MNTPKKPNYRVLNSSYTPYSTMTSSKVSTFQQNEMGQNSSSNKKFTRKRDGSNDSLKRFKAVESTIKLKRKQHQQCPQNEQKPKQKGQNFLSRLNFKRQPILSSKYVKLTSGRTNNEDEFRSFNSSVLTSGRNTARFHTLQSSDQNIDLYMQLDIKKNQLIVLEDQNQRLKNILKQKEQQNQQKNQQHQKQYIEIKQHYELKINLFTERIKKLQFALQQKNSYQQNLQKQQKHHQQVLRKSQNQIQMLRIFIDNQMSKKLPKNTLQIQSFRQVSLQNQINQLKRQLNRYKNQQNIFIQDQITQFKSTINIINHQNSTLEIANRILNKRVEEADQKVQKKLKSQFSQLKQKMKVLMQQCSKLKKQNMKLKSQFYEIQSRQSSLQVKNINSCLKKSTKSQNLVINKRSSQNDLTQISGLYKLRLHHRQLSASNQSPPGNKNNLSVSPKSSSPKKKSINNQNSQNFSDDSLSFTLSK